MIKHTQQVLNYVDHLIHIYHENNDHSFSIEINEIPDFELNKLASLIISSNPSLMSEATGPDNSSFERMSKTLIAYMSETEDEQNSIIFADAWRGSITNYLMPIMDDLLSKSLCEYKQNHIDTKYVSRGTYPLLVDNHA